MRRFKQMGEVMSAVVVTAAMAAPLGALPPAAAGQTMGVAAMSEADEETLDRETGDSRPTQTGVRATARASAKAGSTHGPSECRAESSATAEAEAGPERAFEQDHDVAVHEDGGCRAEAEAAASATTGKKE
jgi:hypothetical protein